MNITYLLKKHVGLSKKKSKSMLFEILYFPYEFFVLMPDWHLLFPIDEKVNKKYRKAMAPH